MTRTAIFPGSFDPFTRGHQDVVSRGASLFDKVIIAIGVNSNKTRFFELEKMMDCIQRTFEGVNNIEVTSYEGLTAVFAKEAGAKYILRGLRNATDLEYENAIAQANADINPDLETVYLMTKPELSHISSTIAREIYRHNGDVSAFVPYAL